MDTATVGAQRRPHDSIADIAPAQPFDDAGSMLQCVRCLCLSDEAEGWVVVAREAEDAADPDLATYCPPCADVEERRVGKAPGYD
jgi:hypothetical protein